MLPNDFLSRESERRHVSLACVAAQHENSCEAVAHELFKDVPGYPVQGVERYRNGAWKAACGVAHTVSERGGDEASSLPGHFERHVLGLQAVSAERQVDSMFFNASDREYDDCPSPVFRFLHTKLIKPWPMTSLRAEVSRPSLCSFHVFTP